MASLLKESKIEIQDLELEQEESSSTEPSAEKPSSTPHTKVDLSPFISTEPSSPATPRPPHKLPPIKKQSPLLVRSEPLDPSVRIEPLEPSVRIEPVEPSVRIEPVEPSVRIEPVEPSVSRSTSPAASLSKTLIQKDPLEKKKRSLSLPQSLPLRRLHRITPQLERPIQQEHSQRQERLERRQERLERNSDDQMCLAMIGATLTCNLLGLLFGLVTYCLRLEFAEEHNNMTEEREDRVYWLSRRFYRATMIIVVLGMVLFCGVVVGGSVYIGVSRSMET